eukprot:Sspe_Gene.84997::Locus_55828_Transcript_1_1_Confidence_1.000_Length_639::g.84997::m.84997
MDIATRTALRVGWDLLSASLLLLDPKTDLVPYDEWEEAVLAEGREPPEDATDVLHCITGPSQGTMKKLVDAVSLARARRKAEYPSPTRPHPLPPSPSPAPAPPPPIHTTATPPPADRPGDVKRDPRSTHTVDRQSGSAMTMEHLERVLERIESSGNITGVDDIRSPTASKVELGWKLSDRASK